MNAACKVTLNHSPGCVSVIYSCEAEVKLSFMTPVDATLNPAWDWMLDVLTPEGFGRGGAKFGGGFDVWERR